MLLHFHVLLCGLCSLGHIPLPYVHMSVYEAEIFCIHYFCEAVKQENKCILNSQIILNDEVKLNIIYVTLSRRVLWVVSVQPV